MTGGSCGRDERPSGYGGGILLRRARSVAWIAARLNLVTVEIAVQISVDSDASARAHRDAGVRNREMKVREDPQARRRNVRSADVVGGKAARSGDVEPSDLVAGA